MNKTAIEWTNVTWNPNSGCERVSEGCRFCYAETLAENKRGTPAFPNGFELTLRPHKLSEPKRLKSPSLIFVNSMSDLFWDQIPDSYRHQILDVIDQTPQHQYQILTKRPEAMLQWSRSRPFPRNVWAGVTIESQRWIDRLAVLKSVEAKIRFVSLEPLLSPLTADWTGIQWAIIGGESGAHLMRPSLAARRSLVQFVPKEGWRPRPERVAWIRRLIHELKRNDVSVFFKQLGGATPKSGGNEVDGTTWSEFPNF